MQKKKKGLEKANRRARRACRRAVKSQAMFWIIIVLVFLNTCVLATEHYDQPAWLDDFQEITNLFFVTLFTCEMFLKMYSLGFQVSDWQIIANWIVYTLSFTLGLFRLVVQSVRLLRGHQQHTGVDLDEERHHAPARPLRPQMCQTTQGFQGHKVGRPGDPRTAEKENSSSFPSQHQATGRKNENVSLEKAPQRAIGPYRITHSPSHRCYVVHAFFPRLPQVLGRHGQPGQVSRQLHILDQLAAGHPLPVHLHLLLARNADLRRTLLRGEPQPL